jgi:hypothetical protein
VTTPPGDTQPDSATPQPSLSRWLRIALWLVACILVVFVALGTTALILFHHVQPFLRDRVVDSLAARFHAHVELDDFHASAADNFSVTGRGLRIIPFGLEQYPPVISVDSFSFQMRLADLLDPRHHVRLARVEGLHITLPPGPDRKDMHLLGDGNKQHGDGDKQHKDHHITEPKLFVDAIVADNAQLTLLTDKPGKLPLQFNIHHLHLTSQWDTGAMHYKASLTNAKPVGEIQSEGSFGPWDADNPRTTPVDGNYTFDHADLATTKGIAGILSSTGHFAGPLDHLTVDGQANVPDFRIQEAEHSVALSTTFHAIVDGTSGDTYLQPVQAHFRNTYFTCTGSVVRVKEGNPEGDPSEGSHSLGHHIALQVTMQKGRIEDLLWLAVKTSPPVITGNVQLHNSFDLPPDPTHTLTVARRLGLKGVITITQMHFSNPDLDKKVDSISLRTQGKAKEARQIKDETGPDSISLDGTLHGNFTLAHGVLNLDPAVFTLPGVDATLHGNYSLDGQQMDFTGNAKLQATVSQMFTGWKSLLLKPVDPLFEKHGAGTYIPFHVGGTRGSPKFGIEFGKLK